MKNAYSYTKNEYVVQADYRPNGSANYYNLNDSQDKVGYRFDFNATNRENVRELETTDYITEMFEVNPNHSISSINTSSTFPRYIRCKDDTSTTRVPLVGHIGIGPSDASSAPQAGKLATLEVEAEFTSSTAFDLNNSSLVIDVGSVLIGAVQMGIMRYSRSAYLHRMTMMFFGIVKDYVAGRFVIGMDFRLDHTGWVSQTFDSFTIVASAQFTVNRLESRIQRADETRESSTDGRFSVLSDFSLLSEP